MSTAKHKFNSDNLPNLRIRVTTLDESERVQRAFFMLGYNWVNTSAPEFDVIKRAYITAESESKELWLRVDSALIVFEEITLQELEALAFDLSKLPDLKVRVNTPQESEQAIRILIDLGYVGQIWLRGDSECSYLFTSECASLEITLEQLKALAA